MKEINHIAFIMDGNRRYAKKNMIETFKAYTYGSNKALEYISYQVKYKVMETSFFALSCDNYKLRPIEEKLILAKVINSFLDDERVIDYLSINKFKIRIIGNIAELKKDKEFDLTNFFKIVDQINSKNEKYRFYVNIAINYDGEKEIVNATKKIAKLLEKGDIKLNAITPKLIKSHIDFRDSEPPQIIVRPGNAPRLSGFMLWDSKYSEIYLTKKLWPEMNEGDFVQIIDWFKNIERNFGK